MTLPARAADWDRANDANFVALATRYATVIGGTTSTADNLLRIDSGTAMAYYTGVFHYDLAPDAVPAAIAAAQASFAGRRWGWWVTPTSRPQDVAAPLEAAGLVRRWSDEGMALPLDAVRWQPEPPGLSVAPVRDLDGLHAWLATNIAGFGMAEEYAVPFRRIVQAAFESGADVGPYLLARLDGAPVGAACLLVTGTTAGVVDVAVVPSARRQGVGAAVTQAVLRAGIARGCTLAVLQASAMGAPVYRRLGFQTTCAFTVYTPA